jgi:hypothetical protein
LGYRAPPLLSATHSKKYGTSGNPPMAKESANTNTTIKQMMIQQTETMNTLMMLMTRNKERRQEIPIRVIQQASTPSSTITNSQYSQSQQSTIANKRKIDGIADDETAAVSTVVNEPNPGEKDDTDAMLEEQSDAIEEIRTEEEENDTTMTDKDHNTQSQQQQEQQETSTNRITAAQQTNKYRQDKQQHSDRSEPSIKAL